MKSTDLLLYAITDRRWLGGKSLEEVVRECLEGGATMIQLREKDLDEESFRKEALEIQKLCREFQVPFLLDDNVKLAAEVDADGVHVGQSDMALEEARRILGPDKIIGVSAQTYEQALAAKEGGADYIGVGAIFPTSSKDDAEYVKAEEIEKMKTVKIPKVAIGGITLENIKEMKDMGFDGISVISAIFAQKDIRKASEDLLKEVKKYVHSAV